MKTPNIPPAAEKARKEMQEQLDLGTEALNLDADATANGQLPAPHQLTAFLMRRLKKQQAAIRATVSVLCSGGDTQELARRLDGLL